VKRRHQQRELPLNYNLFFCSEYTTILNVLDEPVGGYRPLVAGCPAASVIIVVADESADRSPTQDERTGSKQFMD
jgi:hypothetical protein